jgi:hypothetical protein
MTAEITVRWLSFQDHRDEILQLRRQVYVEEQKLHESLIASPQDESGLHIGAFQEERLVSSIAAYVYESAAPPLAEYRLPPIVTRAVQFTKRVSRRGFRGAYLNEAVTAMLVRAAHEALRPQLMFLTLKGPHRAMQSYYGSTYGFELHAEIEASDGAETVMTIPDEERLRASYLKVHRITEAAFAQHGLRAPSLARFLERVGRLDLLALDRRKQDDPRAAPQHEDDLPRPTAQTGAA